MALTINRKLLPIKVHYFMFHAAISAVVPYLATYARQLGFSTVIVGLIYTTVSIVTLVTKPLFGYVADKFRMHKILIIILQVVIASAFMGIHFLEPISVRVPFVLSNAELQFCPDVEPPNKCLRDQVLSQRTDEASMLCTLNCTRLDEDIQLDIRLDSIKEADKCLQFIVNNITILIQNATECEGSCSNPNVMHILSSNMEETPSDLTFPAQFWFFSVFMVFSSAGIATLSNLSNAVCSTLLGDRQRHLFGKQRLWGSLGWGAITLFAGLIVDQMSRGQILKDYTAIFYLMLAWMTGDLIVAAATLRITQTERSKSMVADVTEVCLRPRIIVFFIWCMLCGIANSLVGNFLFWHLEDISEAAATCEGSSTSYMKTLQGLVMVVQTFGGEIPFMYVSGKLMKIFGYAHVMSLVVAGIGARFLLYSVLTNPWWTLPIELLQGLTEGLLFTTLVSYSGKVAPLGAEATMQGLSSAIFDGVGKSVGGLIGGYAMKNLGGSMMFRYFGCGALALCTLHIAVHLLFNRICPETEQSNCIDEVSGDILSRDGVEGVSNVEGGHKYTAVASS